ncbi:MAG: hypothetical protein JKY33_10775 [Bacteroidia bacterium]|nr:hypothetical protein [Bacteroidia bacterium]
MKYHKSSITHDPEQSQWGDCFRTCLACLLDYPNPLNVPHFFDFKDRGFSEQEANNSFDRASEWLLMNHRMHHVIIPWTFENLTQLLEHTNNAFPNVTFMLVGQSKISNHVVICKNGKIIHDPSNSAESPYLFGPCDDGFWRTEFLVVDIK